jgi:hypothetical protein
MSLNDGPPRLPHGRVGEHVVGAVTLVQPWGVYVDVGLDHLGYIDPTNIQDDLYLTGGRFEGHIVDFRERSKFYELEPTGRRSEAKLAGSSKSTGNLLPVAVSYGSCGSLTRIASLQVTPQVIFPAGISPVEST